MKKRIILLCLIGLVITTLAYSGYRYSLGSLSKEPQIDKKVTTDKFAINELIAVIKKYESAFSIEANFTTNIISLDGQKVLESFEGRYVRDSSGLYIKSYKSENLLNRDYLIAIDNDEHVIYIEKPEMSQSASFFQNGLLYDVDSLIHLQDSLIFYKKMNGQTAKLIVEIPSGNYYKTEFIYDIQTREIKELRLYPYEEVFMYETDDGEIGRNGLVDLNTNNEEDKNTKVAYVSIVYTKLSMNLPISKKWFSTERIFTRNNNGIELKNQYKNYEIEFE